MSAKLCSEDSSLNLGHKASAQSFQIAKARDASSRPIPAHSGHQCHLGHCPFVKASNSFHAFLAAALPLQIFNFTSPKSERLLSLFRPPIA
jgi:hypothetical protein